MNDPYNSTNVNSNKHTICGKVGINGPILTIFRRYCNVI